MRTTLRLSPEPRFAVPASILGQNIEVSPAATSALLSDRLRNSKFLGPAQHQTGIAPEWLPRPSVTLAGMQCSLVSGMSYSGNESQLIQAFRPYRKNMGIQQAGVAIAAGEKLEIELWAKPWHRPVALQVGLAPAALRAAPYGVAELQVDAGYWKRYGAVLDVSRSDDQAVFFTTHMAEHFELSSFYQVLGGLGYVHRRGTRIETMCLADVFRLYRPAYPGSRLALDLPSPALIGNDPMLDAIALRNDAGVWVLIANRSPVESAQVDMPGLRTAGDDTMMLAAADPEAPLQPHPYRVGDALPPLSMLRLHLPLPGGPSLDLESARQ